MVHYDLIIRREERGERKRRDSSRLWFQFKPSLHISFISWLIDLLLYWFSWLTHGIIFHSKLYRANYDFSFKHHYMFGIITLWVEVKEREILVNYTLIFACRWWWGKWGNYEGEMEVEKELSNIIKLLWLISIINFFFTCSRFFCVGDFRWFWTCQTFSSSWKFCKFLKNYL